MQKAVTHLDTPRILQGLYRVRKVGQCTAHIQGALFLGLMRHISQTPPEHVISIMFKPTGGTTGPKF
eukprot:g48124.t1